MALVETTNQTINRTMKKEKKWSLIKKAYENYPRGTKYKYVWANETQTSSGIFRISKYADGSIGVVDSETRQLLFCTDGLDWAEIVPEENKTPIDKPEKLEPLLTSEDGFELFEGDEFVCARLNTRSWVYSDYRGEFYTLSRVSLVLGNPDEYKAFKNKENALAWIEKQNNKVKVGEIVKAFDDDEDDFVVGKLIEIGKKMTYPYILRTSAFMSFKNAKKLTKEEVIQLLFDNEKTN